MKFKFFNDTGREVNIHPATQMNGCQCEISKIKQLEIRTFILPDGTYPWEKGGFMERKAVLIYWCHHK